MIEKSSSVNISDRNYDTEIILSQCELPKYQNETNPDKKMISNIPKLDLKNIYKK
jgi:hypothetical protein